VSGIYFCISEETSLTSLFPKFCAETPLVVRAPYSSISAYLFLIICTDPYVCHLRGHMIAEFLENRVIRLLQPIMHRL